MIARLRRSCRFLAAAFLADPVTFLPPPAALRAPAPCGRPDPPCGRPDPPCGRPEPPCVLAAGRPAGRLPSEPVAPWSVPRSSIRSILLGRSAPTRAQRQFPPAGDPQILTALPASTEPTRRPARPARPSRGCGQAVPRSRAGEYSFPLEEMLRGWETMEVVMAGNSFGSRSGLEVENRSYEIFRLDALEPVAEVSRLPFSLKILLENLLRTEDGHAVTAADVEALARFDPRTSDPAEIAFLPSRVLMQDFTGVPAVVDLAAMRDAMVALGGDPARINPLVPAELVIDHSVIADVAGRPDAFARNAELEFERNRERYAFLRWGQQAFDSFQLVPPDTGIVHQVNLEYLAKVVFVREGTAYPDTVVGTDSHTPMVNGLGVLGWGVGGIEAEAAMLGQPISMLTPRVVGFRRHGVVGKFVEFYGPGVGNVPVENRATIGNMSPEYGSTVAIFPVDGETLRYLEFTGRSPEQIALVEAYTKEQGLFHDPDVEPIYSERIELDLSTVVPSLAGPTRPQDRIALTEAKAAFRRALAEMLPAEQAAGAGATAGAEVAKTAGPDEASAESFPASDAPAVSANGDPAPGEPVPGWFEPDPTGVSGRANVSVPVRLSDGTGFDLDHGDVVIAAITSCTNTSNPSVMTAAGLLAKKAVERGLQAKPWVKTSLAPGSKVVMDYYQRAGLVPYLEKLGFHLVGYGCTTCIGNSGPLAPEVSAAIDANDLVVCSVLSGNRNFEGRINPDCRMNYLAS